MERQMNGNGHNLLPPADLTVEIQKLQEEILQERDKNLRTLADFKNYRRRIERDGLKTAENGKREIILPLLDIIDDLEKALKWTSSEEPISSKGVRMIHNKFLALLGAQGIRPFESIGMRFEHTKHEAVAIAQLNGSESGIITDELRRGYLWNDEVLRAAQVRVAG